MNNKYIGAITPTVRALLEQEPDTRNSDTLLYLKVCEKFCPGVTGMAFGNVMANRAKLGLPNFGAVERIRRHLQSEHKELRHNKAVDDMRFENFKEVLKEV